MWAAAAARPDSPTGRSHGAALVSDSSALASAADGFQRRGGATTRARLRHGASAAIIAVSARKFCSAANREPAGELADAVVSTLVIPESASSIPILVPIPVVVASSALSNGASTGGSFPLISTRVRN